MNIRWGVVRAGIERGWIELKQTYTNLETLIPALIVGGGFVLVMVLTRGIILIGVATTLIPGSFLFRGLAVGSAAAWLTLIWVLALGLIATLPIGAVLGSPFPSARSAGLVTLAIGGIAGIRDFLSDHPSTAVDAVGRAGLPAVLAGAGDALGPAAGQPDLSRNRPLVAASGDVRRTGCVGRGGTARGAGAAAPDGPARVRVCGNRALSVRYQTVGYLERGEYSPSLYLALRIAEYFEVPVEVVFSTEPFPWIGSAEGSVS